MEFYFFALEYRALFCLFGCFDCAAQNKHILFVPSPLIPKIAYMLKHSAGNRSVWLGEICLRHAENCRTKKYQSGVVYYESGRRKSDVMISLLSINQMISLRFISLQFLKTHFLLSFLCLSYACAIWILVCATIKAVRFTNVKVDSAFQLKKSNCQLRHDDCGAEAHV